MICSDHYSNRDLWLMDIVLLKLSLYSALNDRTENDGPETSKAETDEPIAHDILEVMTRCSAANLFLFSNSFRFKAHPIIREMMKLNPKITVCVTPLVSDVLSKLS